MRGRHGEEPRGAAAGAGHARATKFPSLRSASTGSRATRTHARRGNMTASLLSRLLLIVSLCLPTGRGLELVPSAASDGKPPAVFSAARHQTTAELEKVLAEAEGDEEKRLELVNAEWGTKHPIDIAVMNGAADVVQLLIAAGAQLHNPGASALAGSHTFATVTPTCTSAQPVPAASHCRALPNASG